MELPEVTCWKCYMVQAYRHQEKCIHCGAVFNSFAIAEQLRDKKFRGESRIDLMKRINEHLEND